jgi:hypothetical protein
MKYVQEFRDPHRAKGAAATDYGPGGADHCHPPRPDQDHGGMRGPYPRHF